MTDSVAPAPPKVHAPARLGAEAAPADALSLVTPAAAPVGLPVSSQGATVTARVGAPAPAAPVPAAPVPAAPVPGTPTTSTGRTPGAPEDGLARTGADVVLLLLLAVAAVALGVLLVRLGADRTPSSRLS